MATFLTGDEALDSARADVLHNDQQRAAPALPGSAAAASAAAAMQNQHVADDVMSAARRIYLGMPADAADEVRPFAEYVVVEMKTQVVAGTNYFFKVRVGADEHIFLRVFVSLFGDQPRLVALRKGAAAAGPIDYFE